MMTISVLCLIGFTGVLFMFVDFNKELDRHNKELERIKLEQIKLSDRLDKLERLYNYDSDFKKEFPDYPKWE